MKFKGAWKRFAEHARKANEKPSPFYELEFIEGVAHAFDLEPQLESIKSRFRLQRDEWLEEFLDGAPNMREAHEKGTASFELRGNFIVAHYSPDYYLDLIEFQKTHPDKGDPWTGRPGRPVEETEPGYNFKENRDHPDNRKWAVERCKFHETLVAAAIKENATSGPGRQSNTRIAVPKLGL